MRTIITVGVGDYYARIVGPTLLKMQAEGIIDHAATVDVRPKKQADGIEHIIRKEEPLSELLSRFKDRDPMVILAHTNHMHVPDTIDLSTHGFKVALEKPYALTIESLNTLLRHANLENVYLLEYYLMMKTAPLLFGYGKIHKRSFYTSFMKPREGLSAYADTVAGFYNKLPDIVGIIRSVSSDVLEGEGEVGRLNHRGVATSDIRAGGGMIQDMLIHAIAPVAAIGSEVGKLIHRSSRVAISFEYSQMAETTFGLKKGHIGESYAEVDATTSEGVSARLRVGKYVFGDRNVRGVTLEGDKGRVYMDTNDCVLYVNGIPVLEITKDEYKYYAVIRSAIEFFDGKPLYNFNQNTISSKSQGLVLHIQDEVYRTLVPVYYHEGAWPEDIFPNPKQ